MTQDGMRALAAVVAALGVCWFSAGAGAAPSGGRGHRPRQLAAMDSRWARHARSVGARAVALTVGRQAERCRRAANHRRSCPHDAVLPVPVADGLSKNALGRVLAGTKVRSAVVHGLPYHESVGYPADPLAAHYPDGKLPLGPPEWRNLATVPPGDVLPATTATSVFNAPGSRYRIAYNLAHYGGVVVNIGRFSGHQADDLAISDHYAFVDGRRYAGEVDVYYGRRGREIDPRQRAPDIIFYGDQTQAKLGISVSGAGDVNGDGWPDLLLAATFHSTDHGRIANGGTVYLVYGGFLQQFRSTVKLRVQDIGRTIPGIQLEGGYDGRLYAAWANDLDGGDFNGDRLSDVVIGSYDPYERPHPTVGARAYLIYGSRRLPLFYRSYRLGVDRRARRIHALTFQDPDPVATNSSLGFSASFVGDVAADGHDALAFTADRAGPTGGGQAYIFTRPPPTSQGRPIDMRASDVTISADDLDQGGLRLRFMGLEGVRPAGDVNGDGVADVIVTARHTQSLLEGQWTPVGAAAVLYGRRAGLPANLQLSGAEHVYFGDEHGQVGQPATDHSADFNGDGRADVLLADPYYLEPIGGQLQERGRMWLIASAPAEPKLVDVEAAATRYLVADTTLPGLFGFTWDSGDFDGDGRPDLVVSDHYEGDRALDVHAGVVYLFRNSELAGRDGYAATRP